MSESVHARDAAAPVPVRVYTLHVRRVRTMYTKERFTRERSSFVVRSFVLSFARSCACISALHEGMAHLHVRDGVHAYVYVRVRMGMRVAAAAGTRACVFLHFMIYRAAFSGPQSVLKARRLIKEIIEDAK